MAHYIALIILARHSSAAGHAYDTEDSQEADRIRTLASFIEGMPEEDLFEMGRWFITTLGEQKGEVWFDLLKEWVEERHANRAKLAIETPFMDRDKQPFKMLPFNVVEVDSLSAWRTTAESKMTDDTKIGDSEANTLFMKQGLYKKRLIQEVPPAAVKSNSVVIMTAHVGEKIQMDPRSPPAKTLQYLRQGMKLKGVAPDFEYLMHIVWIALAAPPLLTKDKVPQYPRDSDDNVQGDTDLIMTDMIVLRNKSGPSGMHTQLIYSQAQGLLPSLTEFHYCISHDRFGLEGNLQNYAMVLLPDVKLSRTMVRRKLDTDEKLRRAVNITSELCQMHHHWHHMKDKLCTAEELYNDIKSMGYDWDLLLQTRGWWTSDKDHPVPFLSTVDLLRMRWRKYHPDHEWGYHPYWYPVKMEDLKPV
jgi:hypothetical protein